MKQLLNRTTAALLAAGAAAAVQAGGDPPANAGMACAEVVEVQPLYRQVQIEVPQHRCWTAWRKPATGASDGTEATEAGNWQTMRYCEMVDRDETREELVGYRVKYRHRGRVFDTQTATHPGERVRVDNGLHPIHF